MNKEDFDREIEKIPFPDHIFKDMSKKSQDILKRNWSGNPQKFIANCENELGIKLDVRGGK